MSAVEKSEISEYHVIRRVEPQELIQDTETGEVYLRLLLSFWCGGNLFVPVGVPPENIEAISNWKKLDEEGALSFPYQPGEEVEIRDGILYKLNQ